MGFNDEQPALPHMTHEERENYLAAVEELSKAKEKRHALLTNSSGTCGEDPAPFYEELCDQIFDANHIIQQIINRAQVRALDDHDR
jgi:hypothetical protein